MEYRIQELCDLIVKNRNVLKKKLFWQTAPNSEAILGAILCAQAGVSTDGEKFAECRRILRGNAGIFSEFRGIAMSLVITKMMLADSPETYLRGAMAVYKKLRNKHKFTASPYMVMAALTLYEHGGVEKADENIERLDELYQKLKAEHPLLIWDQDRGYLAMLVACEVNTDQLVLEIENCYQASRGLWYGRDALHSVAQILALSSMKSAEVKAEEFRELLYELKVRRKRVSGSYGLPAVAALTLLPGSASEKAELMSEIDEYIKKQSGFRWHQYEPRVRRIFAALILFMAKAPEQSTLTESISGSLTMTLIEEMITLMIIMMTSAQVAASSSAAHGS